MLKTTTTKNLQRLLIGLRGEIRAVTLQYLAHFLCDVSSHFPFGPLGSNPELQAGSCLEAFAHTTP